MYINIILNSITYYEKRELVIIEMSFKKVYVIPGKRGE